MNINRNLFFALTGAMASVALAPACGGPPDPSYPEPATTPLRVQPDAPDASVGLPPPVEAGSSRRRIEDDPQGGMTSKAFDQHRTKCDDKGPQATCPPDNTVYPTSEACNKNLFLKGREGPARGRCPVINEVFKPRVATAAWKCFWSHPAKQPCGWYETLQCVHGALMDACPDPAVEKQCLEIADKCDGVETYRCMSYLSGMTDAGRKKLVSCVTKTCMSFLECAGHIATPE